MIAGDRVLDLGCASSPAERATGYYPAGSVTGLRSGQEVLAAQGPGGTVTFTLSGAQPWVL